MTKSKLNTEIPVGAFFTQEFADFLVNKSLTPFQTSAEEDKIADKSLKLNLPISHLDLKDPFHKCTKVFFCERNLESCQ